MANTLALLVSAGGDALAVGLGDVDFFYTPGAEDGATAVAGGYGSSKKKWVVRRGGKLEVYRTAAEAALAIESQPAANDAKETPKEEPAKPAEKEKPVQVPKPVEVVTLGQIKALAKQYGEIAAYREAVNKARYDGLIALFERLQDEEDVELLLAYA